MLLTTGANKQENESSVFDFEKGYPTLEEQQHYCQNLLHNQVSNLSSRNWLNTFKLILDNKLFLPTFNKD